LKFDPPACPKCGADWFGTVETIPGNVAHLIRAGDGAYEYDGTTDINYDGQTTDTAADGGVVVFCRACRFEGSARRTDHIAGPADLTPPRVFWAVQYAEGGIPQQPFLFDSEEAALRCFVETAVAEELEFTEDCGPGWIGNDEDEVRMWGPIGSESVAPPKPKAEWKGDGFESRALNEKERAEADRILASIREPKL
jgi:hypothetical protein